MLQAQTYILPVIMGRKGRKDHKELYTLLVEIEPYSCLLRNKFHCAKKKQEVKIREEWLGRGRNFFYCIIVWET